MVAHLRSSADPEGAAVTANARFNGRSPSRCAYELSYRGNTPVNEIWQVDPTLAVPSSGGKAVHFGLRLTDAPG